MISEKTFIKYYSSYWDQLLPGIDHYVRLINSFLIQSFEDPINIKDIPQRRALINSIVYDQYHVFRTNNENNIIDSLNDIEYLEDVRKKVLQRLKQLDNKDLFQNELSSFEIQIIKIMFSRMQKYFKYEQNLITYPYFQGCGLIFNCFGDAYADGNLIEIKSGNSNYTKYDLYQLITYSALNYVSESPVNIEKFKLVNFRQGTEWEDNIEDLFHIISGQSSVEIFSDIINYISNNYRSI